MAQATVRIRRSRVMFGLQSNGRKLKMVFFSLSKQVFRSFMSLEAISIRHFLNSTQSQLTYHGLFHLASALSPDTLSALFRGSHLSVIYRSAPTERHPDPTLYTLVTDQSFLHESSVVWEKFGDVDGQGAEFVDSDFIRSTPAGGDYAGETGESTLAAIEAQMARAHLSSPEYVFHIHSYPLLLF